VIAGTDVPARRQCVVADIISYTGTDRDWAFWIGQCDIMKWVEEPPLVLPRRRSAARRKGKRLGLLDQGPSSPTGMNG